MTTSFPSGIDTRTRPASVDTLGTTGVFLDVVIDDAFDAIEALEAKVGIDGSAATTSHDYKIAQLERGGRVFKARAGIATNVTLASAVENGDTLDGVVLATNDVVALLGQTTAADNGLYKVNASGAPTRIIEFDASAEVLSGTLISISEGTANKDSIWQLTTNAPITIGSTSLVFFPIHLQGTGTPESVVTAPIGATYRRTDGSTGTTFYVKESGTGSTGWAAHGAAGSSLTSASTRVNTQEGTSSTTYTALTTAQAATITPGASGCVLVILTASMWGGPNYMCRMAFTMSSGNTLAASDQRALEWTPPANGMEASMSSVFLLTGLTLSSTVFTAQFLTDNGANTAHFQDREITVLTW